MISRKAIIKIRIIFLNSRMNFRRRNQNKATFLSDKIHMRLKLEKEFFTQRIKYSPKFRVQKTTHYHSMTRSGSDNWGFN